MILITLVSLQKSQLIARVGHSNAITPAAFKLSFWFCDVATEPSVVGKDEKKGDKVIKTCNNRAMETGRKSAFRHGGSNKTSVILFGPSGELLGE